MPAQPALLLRARALLAALLLTLTVTPVLVLVSAPSAAAAGFGQTVLDEAAKHAGKPYSYGSTGPGSFDCSGFTGYVYRQLGISLPRTSTQQYEALPKVTKGRQELGDLIFTYNSGGIYHVGIYAGDNQMWAATKAGDVVRKQAMWTDSYVVARPYTGGAIGQRWQDLGGSRGVLGQTQSLEHDVPAGRKVDHAGGDVYWSNGTGAREVYGGIAAKYDAVGGSGSALGLPTTGEESVPGGRRNRFLGGTIYWSQAYDAKVVRGGINQKYDALGGPERFLGLPASDETAVAGGAVSSFAGGRIWWSPAQGAREVHGAILQKYLELGGAGGSLGFPTSDERDAPGGRENTFERGVIRWDAASGRVDVVPA